MRPLVPLLVALLVLPPVLAGPGPTPAAAPPYPVAWQDPEEALLLAVRGAGLDPHRVLALAEPGPPSPDPATAYARLLAGLGLPDRPLPALPAPVAAALVPILDAATDAVRLRSEALAPLPADAHARLDRLHDAYVTSRGTDDRDSLAVAWAEGGLPTGLDRERVAAAAHRLLEAARTAAPELALVADAWSLADDADGLCVDDGVGVLIVCGPDDDMLTGNHILEIDLGGNDHHATNAGASGIGVLWPGTNGLPAALALDLSGDDTYGGGAQVQGAGSTTPGVLVDLEGNDHYHSAARGFNFAQGAGNLGGVGLLYDAVGDDLYTTPWSATADTPARDTQGFGILGGIGVLFDGIGTDLYVGGEYAQGSGDFNAVGLLVDGEGDDGQEALKHAQGFADGAGLGLLLDGTGNDHRLLWAGLGQGAAVGGGALLFDASGNDHYVALEGRAQGWAAEGVVWKPVNDVLHLLGVKMPGSAFVVDLEGDDTWIGSRGCDLCVWVQGTGAGIDTL